MFSSGQTAAADWRRLYPFKSQWIELAGGRMHYLDEGPMGPGGDPQDCLLFVHGNPTWSFHWRRLILALRHRYRCVAPDHLGCGLSDKPQRFIRLEEHIDNLVALVKHLHADRVMVTLIAQDWGGPIGLGAMIALRNGPRSLPIKDDPPPLERIVLFNTGAFRPRYIPWQIRACRIPLLGRLAVQGGNLFSRAALRMTLARRRLEPEIAAGYLAPYDNWAHRCAVYGFVHDIPRGPHHPTWPVLAEIEYELPTLGHYTPAALIWGMRDWCFRPDSLDHFVRAWPHAEVHRLPDVGHWVVEDAPDESLAILQRFLDRHPSGQSADSFVKGHSE